MVSEEQSPVEQNPATVETTPGDTAQAPAAAGADELQQLREQLDEAREQSLRAAAEAQNVRRRAEKDVESARKFAVERFASDLLPVVDNLERALAAASSDAEALQPVLEGIELTYRSFLDALRRHQVEQVDPVGAPFDPQFHEAMSMLESAEAAPNTVLHVMQKGYTLNGRLLRAAMVTVAKGGAAARVDETA